MGPKNKSGDAGHSDKPKRSHTGLPVSVKVCRHGRNVFYRARYSPWFPSPTGGSRDTSPEEERGRPQMPFPSYATSGRRLHDGLLGVSRERRQVARYVVERAPQGPFDVSALRSLMEVLASQSLPREEGQQRNSPPRGALPAALLSAEPGCYRRLLAPGTVKKTKSSSRKTANHRRQPLEVLTPTTAILLTRLAPQVGQHVTTKITVISFRPHVTPASKRDGSIRSHAR